MRAAEPLSSDQPAPIVVVGAGMVGPVVAIYLARRFGGVTLLERQSAPAPADPVPTGRSLHVVVSARGWHALRDLGVEEQVLSISLPLRGRLEHSLTGKLTEQPYSRRGQEIWCVERSRLNRLLRAAAVATPGLRVRHDARVLAVEPDVPAVLVEGLEGIAGIEGTTGVEGRARLTCEHVVGCDGAFSRVREALTDRHDRVQMNTLGLGYKEIRIPAGPDGGWPLPHQFFHIWPRNRLLFSAFPNPGGDFTGSLFLPLHGDDISFETIQTDGDAVALFQQLFPDVVSLIPDLAEQYESHPVNSIVTMSCDRWIWRDTVALVGDSAHAMAPFMGQGMNCGFEDARILDECLARAGEPADWAGAFAEYESLRKPHVEAIAEVSIQHYQHLASPTTTATAQDVLRQRVTGRLYDVFSTKFTPLYERCAFTEEPYAEALQQHLATERLVDDVLIGRDGNALLDMSRNEFADVVNRSRPRT
ncbi:MAG: FAD-dependent oxidoreductase [Mycobacteriales bacterium]